MMVAAVTLGNPLRTNWWGPTRLWAISRFSKMHSSGGIFHKVSHPTTLPTFRRRPFCTGDTVCESYVTSPEERQIPSILWRSGTTAILSSIKPSTWQSPFRERGLSQKGAWAKISRWEFIRTRSVNRCSLAMYFHTSAALNIWSIHACKDCLSFWKSNTIRSMMKFSQKIKGKYPLKSWDLHSPQLLP